MKRVVTVWGIAWVLWITLTLSLLGITTAQARRSDPSPDKGQGCSLEHWRIVVEGDRFRACLLERDGS